MKKGEEKKDVISETQESGEKEQVYSEVLHIMLSDWDNEISQNKAQREAQKLPKRQKADGAPQSTQQVEVEMLGNILSSRTPGSLDELDRYLADNRQKIHDAYVKTWSYRISQIPTQIKALFQNIAKAFNAIVDKRNQLFLQVPHKNREGRVRDIDGDIELQVFSKTEVEAELPLAEPLPVAIPFRDVGGIPRAMVVPVTEQYKEFYEVTPSNEADNLAKMEPLLGNFRTAVSDAMVGLASFLTQGFKARVQERPEQAEEEVRLKPSQLQ